MGLDSKKRLITNSSTALFEREGREVSEDNAKKVLFIKVHAQDKSSDIIFDHSLLEINQ